MLSIWRGKKDNEHDSFKYSTVNTSYERIGRTTRVQGAVQLIRDIRDGGFTALDVTRIGWVEA